MRLTSYTDYALRTLMYLALNRDRLVTIGDIAENHNIAKNHLTKVVHQLGTLGYVETVRGRSGGLRLGREPSAITIGEVVRETESDFYMASCFDASTAPCLYAAGCEMRGALARATSAFLDVLDSVTLEQMVARDPKLGTPGVQAIQLHFNKRAAA
ncbi:Rrf2 family transcriptional regulator [Massilia solisilvae]|uniref:Rrf2 family transcriptional regulator n=1 Tax=Massilia solisilvae TaxID=1811225 RepID=A0ABT2BPK3_9BURK|nr:Rrf2 family transcriptional regulator [Massilia solisilvae]MCS0610400.1 Rrf2 family transcriptional regulator [Massilia solisilvae]